MEEFYKARFKHKLLFNTEDKHLDYWATDFYYCKIPKYSDTRKIAVIILKFEHCGSTLE